MRPDVRVARPADAEAFYGKAVPWPWSGLAIERDGKVVALGGVAWRDDGTWAFLDCPRELMPHPFRAHKLALRVLAAVFAGGETEILVRPTPGVPTAKRWLSALGFAPRSRDGDVEIWSKCRE